MASPEEIFLNARELTNPEARDSFLATACGRDAGLRAAVDAMLKDAAVGDRVFAFAEAMSSPSGHEYAGARIGRYEVLEKIGEGGMGIVYKAEQRQPVLRQVALKVIKAGMDTRQVIARFEAERQALALMDHPNIAKVLDGGETDQGRPYFVMDLVQGSPINQFCAEAKLSIRDRLDLFLDVCSAVQHAHQKGIIHRDLKPSNVLVARHEGRAVPKVIDFGVAKSTQQELTNKTVVTHFQHFIGTPAYVSPEQVELASVDIDTRSDIYSLGVLLYELLTDQTPFDGKELLALGLDEMRRTIREKEPFKPSTRLALRNTTSHSLPPSPSQGQWEIDPDLDWIVMKCLEKDRSRRYGTVNDLAADVTRHLRCEPIVARPPGTAYRIAKVIQRNKGLFLGSTAVTAALIVGFAASVWQAVRATRAEREQARERARTERRLQATVKFLDETFTTISADIANVIGAGTPKQKLAEAGAIVAEELMQGDPPNAEFRQMLGNLNLQLSFSQGYYAGHTSGEFDSALRRALEAIRLFRPVDSTPATDDQLFGLVRAEMAAGNAAWGLLKNDEALLHYRQMQQWAERLATSTNLPPRWRGRDWRNDARGCVASLLCEMGQIQPLHSDLLPLLHKAIAQNNEWGMAGAHRDVGIIYRRLGSNEEALLHFREAHRVLETMASREHAHFASQRPIAQAEFGHMLTVVGQFGEGFSLLTNAITAAKALSQRDPANAGFIMGRIEVFRLNGLGRLAWMENAPGRSEARQRLEEAQYHFSEAQRLLDRIKSPSLRTFILQRDLNPSLLKLRGAEAKFEAASPSGEP